MNLAAVKRLLPSFAQLHTQMALISGGEPLLNPEWAAIAQLLREHGLKVWLLTSGLALAKHAARAAGVFDSITVSLDGTDRETYLAIRGLDAFDKVCEGIRGAADHGARVGIRVTVQRTNYRQLPAFVRLARTVGARSVSFLAVDVTNPHAFGRTDDYQHDLALRQEDLPVFEQILNSVEREHAEDFRSGFIAENPRKLRRLLQYFAAIHGNGVYPTVRCNAPEFSAVIGAKGSVQPCFFISGPAGPCLPDLPDVLNSAPMMDLRRAIRKGERGECKTCVCSLWRNPDNFESAEAIL
jgi:MoaA/NifB/PqqE/SkfB family radical SAM enzyme